jgi:hypothetical protein
MEVAEEVRTAISSAMLSRMVDEFMGDCRSLL